MAKEFAMSSMAIARIVKDLSGRIKLDKIYLVDENLYSFKFYKPGSGVEEWAYLVGKWICKTDYELPKPKMPPPKIIELRKSLGDVYLDKVYQRGFERIIVLEGMNTSGEKIRIVLELFSIGNLVVEKGNKIIYAHNYGAWRHREIKLGVPYSFPPERVNVRDLSLDLLKELVKERSRDLVRFLAVDLGLGGELAEEICFRTGIQKNKKVNELSENELGLLLETIKAIIQECENSDKAYAYFNKDELVTISPIKILNYESSGLTVKEFENIHKAIEELVLKPYLSRDREVERLRENMISKYNRIIEQQMKAFNDLMSKAKELREIADKAYEYFQDLNTAFEIIKKAFKENDQRTLSKARELGVLKEINTSEGYVVIYVPKGNFSIKLNLEKNIHESISEYYSKAKDLENRADKLKESIKEIKEKMEKELETAQSRVVSKKKKERVFWFEKFKWFISSTGHIVVAGKDAKSNEEVVRRYLDEKDLYVHADIHGAPSVVIKSMGKEIDEQTIREACEFAVYHSRAWGRIYVADAYWVYPHQVTKTPNPGEYLPVGAFVIKGKRNYVSNIEVKCGVGLVEIEGHKKLMCAPVSAIKTHSNDYIIIAPGDIDKNVFAKTLAEVYGFETSYVLSILPPGNVSIMEYRGENAKKVVERLLGDRNEI